MFLTASTVVAGVQLDPGRYLLLTSPAPEQWDVSFNSIEGNTTEEQFNNAVELGRGTVPSSGTEQFIETFTIRGVGGGSEGAFILEWEGTRVEIPIRPSASPSPQDPANNAPTNGFQGTRS
jgi:hypothetical protein